MREYVFGVSLRAGLGCFPPLFLVEHSQVKSTAMGHILVVNVAQPLPGIPGDENKDQGYLTNSFSPAEMINVVHIVMQRGVRDAFLHKLLFFLFYLDLN